MQTTSDWCAIRLVTYLSQAADFLGQWGESCPCEHHNDGPQLVKKLSGQRVRVGRQSEGSTCPFRCCRAAELASGKALTLLTALVESQQSKFLKCVATAPVPHQSALTGAWYTATSKLLGSLSQLQIHSSWFITRLCIMFVCCNIFLVLVLVALNPNQYIYIYIHNIIIHTIFNIDWSKLLLNLAFGSSNSDLFCLNICATTTMTLFKPRLRSYFSEAFVLATVAMGALPTPQFRRQVLVAHCSMNMMWNDNDHTALQLQHIVVFFNFDDQ